MLSCLPLIKGGCTSCSRDAPEILSVQGTFIFWGSWGLNGFFRHGLGSFKSALGFVWLLQLHLFLHRWTTRLPPSHTHLSNLRAPGQRRSEVPYCQHSTELGMRFLSAPCTYQTHGCWQAGCRVQSSVLQNVQRGIFQMCSALAFHPSPYCQKRE